MSQKRTSENKSSTTPYLFIAEGPDRANVRYLTGFDAVDPVVVIRRASGRTLMVVPQLEYGRACACAPKVEVRTPEQMGLRGAARGDWVEWSLRALSAMRIRRVAVSAWTPAVLVERLREKGLHVRVDSTPPCPQRAVKRPDEIRKIAESQRACVAGMRLAERALRAATIGRGGTLKWKGAGLTAERLRGAIERVLLDHDVSAPDLIVAGGRSSADPHERGSGPLRAHEPIVIDIFGPHRKHGYCGDMTRTFCKGAAPADVRAMYRAVCRAQREAVRGIRPRVSGAVIHRRVQETLDQAGFVTELRNGRPVGFFHGTGHGIGLDVHESPSLSLRGKALRAGHVVTVEPGLYDPDVGGVRMEDVVCVTPTGCRVLAPARFAFELPEAE